jgi:hypothetical protein
MYLSTLLSSRKTVSGNGYVALTTVLVIAVIVVTIGLSTSLLSINEAQTSLSGKRNEESVDFVDGCIEDALMRLNKENVIPTQIPLPEGTCDVTINAQSGSDWTFTTTGTIDHYTKKIQVQATRTTTVSINAWEEVE